MALKAWLTRKLHHGPIIKRELQTISESLEKIEDDGYKQVIDRALERIEILNTVYRV